MDDVVVLLVSVSCRTTPSSFRTGRGTSPSPPRPPSGGSADESPKEGRGFLMFRPCLESEGFQFDPTFLLSLPLFFCLVLLLFLSYHFLPLAHSSDFFVYFYLNLHTSLLHGRICRWTTPSCYLAFPGVRHLHIFVYRPWIFCSSLSASASYMGRSADVLLVLSVSVSCRKTPSSFRTGRGTSPPSPHQPPSRWICRWIKP